uniref:Putative serine protease pcp-1 (inferred by orthology to a C. elegans protein) n=1 Tax=Anisakis simplex TaxID=6269 RepID=A0A0M3J3K8_ANISI
LIYFIREAFEYFAMVDYPYRTSFLQPLPGWPVQAACNLVKEQYPKPPKEDEDLVKYLYIISNLYYNSTGHETTNCVISKVCGDPATNGLGSDALGWPWQSCTELVMEICAEGGKNDFFWDECKEADGVLNMVKRFCLKTFEDIGYTEKFLFENDAPIEYGLEFAAASNIVFTNGNLDPWSVGGVFEDTPGVKEAAKNGVYTFFITNGAHHLDIRQPNTCDPESVKNARFQVKIHCLLKLWLAKFL